MIERKQLSINREGMNEGMSERSKIKRKNKKGKIKQKE